MDDKALLEFLEHTTTFPGLVEKAPERVIEIAMWALQHAHNAEQKVKESEERTGVELAKLQRRISALELGSAII